MGILESLIQCIKAFTDSYATLFQSTGLYLVKGIATINFAWMGIQMALSSASGQHAAFDWARFARLVVFTGFAFWMINDYHNLLNYFQGMSGWITHQISFSLEQQIMQPVDQALANINSFGLGIFDGLVLLQALIVSLVLVLLEVVAVFVISIGLLCQAICVLLGPLFIPFYLVPYLDFVFWGWLKSLLQYCFYPVIAQSLIFVIGNFFVNYGVYNKLASADELAANFGSIVVVCFVGIFSMFLVPSITRSIFSGSSGESSPVPFL